MEGSVIKKIFARIISIVIFLLILIALNFVVKYVRFGFLINITNFLNGTAAILIFISIIFLAGEIFKELSFPVNLPAPALFAIGGTFLLSFLFVLFRFFDGIMGIDIFTFFYEFEDLSYLLVISLIVVLGYISIFYNAVRESKPAEKEKAEEKPKEKIKETKSQKSEKLKKKEKKTNNVGLKFKEAFSELGDYLGSLFE